MNAPLDRPAHKVPILLYDDDVAYYQRLYGTGWTGRIRELVAKDVRARKVAQQTKEKPSE